MNHQERDRREQVHAEKLSAAISLMQEAIMETETPTSVSFAIEHDRPIQVFSLGDLHLGSLNTDQTLVKELVAYILSTPDVYVVMTGDEIEGRKKGYLSTNAVSTVGTATQQMELFRTMVLKPLVDAGRVMGMVTDYWGHNGWVQDASTADPWKEIIRDLDVNLVTQGGHINVEFASGKVVPVQVFHSARGKSQYDPNHAGRKVQQAQDAGTREGTVFSAHIHRAGIVNENQPDSVLAKVRKHVGVISDDPSLVLVQNGTFKSVNGDLPQDPFGKKLGLPLADKGGQSIEIFSASDGRVLRYPTMTDKHGAVIHTAMEVLNSLESQQMTDEIRERIQSEVEDKPTVRFARELSPTISEEEETFLPDEGSLRDVVWYDIESKLPIRVEFGQNVRFGSKDAGVERYKRYLADTLKDNPHVFLAILRNMVDKQTARSRSRDSVLENVVAAHLPYEEQLLLLMKDSSLKQAAWQRDIGSGDRLSSYGLDPVHELSKRLSVPTVHNKSVLAISLGAAGNMLHRTTYTALLLDKLGNNMSSEKPSFGHFRQYQQELYKPGIMAGGHSRGSGFSSQFDTSNQETDAPIFIAPGWWSDFDAMGKGNMSPGVKPGASVILMPGSESSEYMAFGAADTAQSKELHDALMLYVGLQELGDLKSVSPWLSLVAQR